MLSISNSILLTTAFLNIILGISIFRKNRKEPVNLVFFLLTLNIASWAIALFFFRSAEINNQIFLWGRIVYVIATFLPLLFVLYVFGFISFNKRTKIASLLLSIPALILIYLSFFTSTIVSKPVKGLEFNSVVF